MLLHSYQRMYASQTMKLKWHLSLMFAVFALLSSAQEKTGKLLVELTSLSSLKIDGEDKGRIAANQPTLFILTVGDYSS